MADLTSQERLQPALLDRLTDLDPEQKIESRDRRILSMQRLRECVRRDLAWLLNAGRLETVVDLDDYPRVADSVLNYGIPDLAGMSLAGADTAALEKAVRNVILRFEPRLLKRTLKVTIEADTSSMQRNAVIFRIEADLWSEPVPQAILLQTEVDLETGGVTVQEGMR